MNLGTHQRLIVDVAETIYAAFVNYNDNFRRITQRARRRFERREWREGQRDLAERIELYNKSVDRSVASLRRTLGPRIADRALWRAIKPFYGQRVDDIPAGEFSKTYFSSVTRRIFLTVGIDPEIEFLTLGLETEEHHRHLVKHKTYLNWGSMDVVAEKILRDFAFDTPYADINSDIGYILAEIAESAHELAVTPEDILRVEFMKPVFYQSTRAYIVGKIFWPGKTAPLIIALKNTANGVAIDAVLMSVDSASILFDFARSYFLADVDPVEGAVYFIKSILPSKPIGELYTALGRAKQGKTERYGAFTRHLNRTNDQFVRARGESGLVMAVFTLPSYDLVFKVMRDRFGHPKKVSHGDVVTKYQFVFNHDRAGRLIDSQEFLDIQFPVDRFDPELLDELLSETAATTRVAGQHLIIDRVYIERRLEPLNLYIEERESRAAELAILDYGQAIKDLALMNIFPGDLLLKNFGVTRHGRVIFYDYDELCLLTDCNFREIPEASDDEDEMRSDAWFYVGPNDIFPQEFVQFLCMSAELKSLFLRVHSDLLTAAYWRKIQRQHESDEIPEVIPYFRPTMPDRPGHPRRMRR